MDFKKKTVLPTKEIKRLDVLGARILQKPKNLKRHSQRLSLACRGRHSDYVFGALLDLWIIFKGPHPLKATALEMAAPHLTREQLIYLCIYLEHPFRLAGYMPHCPQAILLTALTARQKVLPSYAHHQPELIEKLTTTRS